jgi:flagellar biogenesis protein FliO
MENQQFEKVIRELYKANRQDEIDYVLLRIGLVIAFVLAVLFILAAFSTIAKYFFLVS